MFYQVAKVQNEQHQKELEKQAKKKEAAICHRMELLKQINEKERERINKVHEKFEEGNALRLEKDIRERHVNEYLVTKMDRLRYVYQYMSTYIQQLFQILSYSSHFFTWNSVRWYHQHYRYDVNVSYFTQKFLLTKTDVDFSLAYNILLLMRSFNYF